ncbi:uncharacterized protein TRIVIDRAFT_79554 [Trichoderma virens Gv29-8]|uniref:Uncharacterized protein n=1 Tax=Hypocrea virens (strain Gv29-8 / FGSC 10586) TaxID=413071 RepID=G9MDY2_HYPVG|nr:uncharacterized protein TRIVIDRAFT_79554 [Trichoderma virens Gv29-8]EHK27278.1 hypothetical protein TRIVIDRAFT_79554 [Trichoderma virens Gv29-8]
MNERTRSAASNGSSRTTRSSGLAAASSSSANGSKTSLFRSHFIRRPNAASSDPEGVRADVEMQQSETADLVVRDQHGEVEIGNPPTPVVDDEEELQALEYQQENEREKQRLAEAIRHYQISHSSMADQPDALFEAVRESNRSKVSALAEDNWMFEPEEQPRIS